MKNFDLFEGETEIPNSLVERTNLSKYQIFKLRNHYRKSNGDKKCGNCMSHESGKYHDKTYHKCRLIGFSNSEATDIRVGHVCDVHHKEER